MLLGLLLSMSGWWVRSLRLENVSFLSTSREVRKDMKVWVLSQEEISGLLNLMFEIQAGIWTLPFVDGLDSCC